MSRLAIQIKQLSKAYRIPHKQDEKTDGGYKTLQEDIMALPGRLVSALRGRGSTERETVWALKDVSFDVHEGEVIGIIGRNGAGKSTLLKILSRITDPSKGQADIYGRLSSLLEVGTGFHPELTGRENIFLNGTIMGMRRHEVAKKFDEIVAFSGVEKHIDTPVKFYSSGMYVRLAFSVAAHLEPEILVVDEVLAVGDAEFQKKSLGRMQEVSKEGRTVLFVSHNMGAIQSLCPRAVWLNDGKVMSDGPSKQVVKEYMELANSASVLYKPQPHLGHADLIIKKIVIKNSQGQVVTSLPSGEALRVEVYFHALKRLAKPYFWIAIGSGFGFLYGANMLFDDARPDYIEGKGMIACSFSSLRLLPQSYTVRIGV
ncbi:MAG: ABC transporter ATP-binding protein, partial [Candidatus Brocadiales bacterium]|nr:ABC transporter ATP-binding protein [Candidatus Brocadiales bacterium]